MKSMQPPSLQEWRSWAWEDYLAFFLSRKSVRARLRGAGSIRPLVNEDNLQAFCRPIRERVSAMFCSLSPVVSIQLPAFNEEVEILPTLVSYTMLDASFGPAELIVCDNGSTDMTAAIARHCGATCVACEEKGIGAARRAAYNAMSPAAKYVWLTDADARVVPPLRTTQDLAVRSTLLRTNFRFLEDNPTFVGLSSGGVLEDAHILYKIIHGAAVALRKSSRYACWNGFNQFVRRETLDAIGGIHPGIGYRDREDHQRHYELARYAKTRGLHMTSANVDPSLADPVYHSGRRRATLQQIVRASVQNVRRIRKPVARDKFGYPVHSKDRVRAE